MAAIFINGIITGLVLSVPFGPIGIYCMEKTLVEGEKEGYAAAMGMVSVDFVYGMISFLFINILRQDIEKYGPIIASFVSLFLICIGIKKISKDPKVPAIVERKGGVFQHYLTVFLVALANVPTIISIIFIYTVINNVTGVSPDISMLIAEGFRNKAIGAFIFSSGIFVGGSFLWGITTWILYHYRKTINHEMIMKITKKVGFILLGFGIYTLIISFKYLLKINGVF